MRNAGIARANLRLESTINVARSDLVGRDSVEPSVLELVQHTLVRPVFRLFHQSGPNWVSPDVIPFLRVAFIASQAMVKSICLKPRRPSAEPTSQFALPKCDPFLDLDCFVELRPEEMEVVGHDHITADNPAIRLRPGFIQNFVNSCIRELSLTLPGTDRDKDNRCLPPKDEDTLSWVTALLKRRRAIPRLDSVSPYQVRATRRSIMVGRDSVEPVGGTHGEHLHHRPKPPDDFLQAFADLA